MVETTEQYRTRINQLKTGIENEPYIKKMRENIAEGISKTGNRQADIEVRQDNLESDFVAVQQDASSVSPSGAEVAVARGNYPTLDKRLTEEQQKVTAQLAQNEVKKADITYVDQVVSRMSGGAIKGTYTTLAALKVAYPDGAVGPFLVEEDGNRYIWDVNKLEWVSIGPYEPAEIDFDSITKEHLTFNAVDGVVGKNKYNPQSLKRVTGMYVNSSNGILYANVNYEVYEMRVFGGENWSINWCDQTAFYDVDGNYISGGGVLWSRGPVMLTVPENATTMKTSVRLDIKNEFQIERGGSSTQYEPYRIILSDEALPVQNIKSIIDDYASMSLRLVTEIIQKIKLGQPVVVKLVGDSITNGVGGTGYDKDGDQLITGRYVNLNGYCWANEVKKYLEEKYSNVTVLNYGVSGTTTAQVWNNRNTLIGSDDDIVIVMLGTNDRATTDLVTFKNNLKNIGNFVKDLGNEVVFMSNIPTSVANENDGTKNFHMEDVDNAVSEVSYQFNQEYVSVYKSFLMYSDLKGIDIDSLLADGLHPNDEGYTVMFKIILDSLGFGIKRPGATW